jgi:serine/threonine protein kinase
VTAVGRYQVRERLGRGAMGVVYKALDPTIGRIVAIKAIRLSDFQDAEEQRRVRERLLREAQSAGLLSHPNIVTIYDVLEQEDNAYIVMEYLGGASLEQMLRSHALPGRDPLLRYLRQVADALDYAHRKGVVHRDVKPANIIITDVGEGGDKLAKVTDFGVAKFISQNTTYSGTIMGTPNYMSPEQIQGLPLDGRSDQFSLAVVVYEALTGAKPFAAESLPTLLYQICRADPKPVEASNPTLSGKAGIAVLRALAKEPDERFGSCNEFIEALGLALEESPHGILPNSSDKAPSILAAAAAAGPVAPVRVLEESPPEPPDHELPSLTRRRAEPEEPDPQPQARNKLGRKLLALLLMGLAVAIAIVLLVRWNSGPPLPTQVANPSAAPHTPPPPTAYPQENLPAQTTEPTARKKSPENAKPAPASSPGVVSAVEFLTEPPGAKLTVDNRADVTCQSPCTLSLPGGRHTLTAELSGFNLARRIFTSPNDGSIFINLSKGMGVLVVTSTPSGSQVLVDGKDYGQTPATVRLTAGPHQLLLVNGAQRHEETVVISNDAFETRSVRWQ